MADRPAETTSRSLDIGGADPILRFADYLSLARHQADRTGAWAWTEIAKALESYQRGERGTAALVTSQRAAQGEVAPGLSLAVQEVPAGEQTTAHRHSFWHLYWVRSGYGAAIIESDREERRLAPADVLFIPSWHAHRFRNDDAVESLILFALQNLPQLASLGCLMRETEAGARVSMFSEAAE